MRLRPALRLAVLCITVARVLPAAAEGIDYRSAYGRDYEDALDLTERYYGTVDARFHGSRIGTPAALSIVFPEVLRYSVLRDVMETALLVLLYVRQGDAYADFSIGPFQMKPSFAALVEETVRDDPTLSPLFPDLAGCAAAPDAAAREARVGRLGSLSWQCVYLDAFLAICWRRFPFLDSCPKEDAVHFLAGAYNAGFSRSYGEIMALTRRDGFTPSRRTGMRYSYCDIASYFYTNQSGALVSR